MVESRPVSLLFCDVVGSTALLTRLGDRAGGDLRRRYLAVLRAAVEEAGGVEVKNLGDGLMASFDVLGQALLCGVLMQRGIVRLDRELGGLGLNLRVGVSAGEASFEDDDWFGTPVVEAARLEAAAEPGQILVADRVVEVAGSLLDVELVSAGTRQLKGLPGELAVSAVEWSPPVPITVLSVVPSVDGRPLSENAAAALGVLLAADAAVPSDLLSAQVADLESVADELAAVVSIDGSAWMLQAERADVDAHRFADLIEEASGFVERADWESARGCAVDALALWATPAPALVRAPAAARWRISLDALVVKATEIRLRSDLAAGRHQLVLDELGDLTRDHPSVVGFWELCARARLAAEDVVGAIEALNGGIAASGDAALRDLLRSIESGELAAGTSGVATWIQASSRGPLPPELAAQVAGVFVARDDELVQIRSAIEASSSAPNVVWVLGEPGIGKTHLTAAATAQAREAGALVLFGRCSQSVHVPFQPFREALRGWLDQRTGSELDRMVPAVADRLAPLVPEVGGAAQSSLEQVDEYHLFEAFRAWVEALGASDRTVIVVDDVHWATSQTIRLIDYLLNSPGAQNVTLICTARTTSPDDNAELRGLIDECAARALPSTTIELGPLDSDAIAAWVQRGVPEQAGEGGTGSIGDRLFEQTGGHPLFVESLIRSLAEDDNAAIPADLSAAVRRRVDRLTDSAQGVLGVAAVLGLDFELDLVAAVAGRAMFDVLDDLEVSLDARLLSETGAGRFQFEHALVRDALADGLSATRRASLHARAAQHLRSREGSDVLAALAHHSLAAVDLLQLDEVVEAVRAAATFSAHMCDHSAAVELFQSALDLIDEDHGDHVETLVDLAVAQRSAGHMAEAIENLPRAFGLAIEAGSPGLAIRAVVEEEKTTYHDVRAGRPLLRRLERAQDLVGTTIEEIAVQIALARTLYYLGERERSIELLENALARSRSLGDGELLADALYALAVHFGADPGELDRIDAMYVEAAALTMSSDTGGGVRCNLATTALRKADRVLMDQRQADFADFVLQSRQPFFAFLKAALDSTVAYLEADLDTAIELANEAAEIGSQLRGEDHSGLHGMRMFQIHRETGALAYAGPMLRRIAETTPLTTLWQPGLAVLYAEMGLADEAQATLASLAPGRFSAIARDANEPLLLSFVADAARLSGSAEFAQALYERFDGWSGQVIVIIGSELSAGPADLYLGDMASMAGHDETAVGHYERAVAVARAIRSPLYECHGLHRWGAHLLRTGDPEAEELLRRAMAIATEWKLVVLQQRVGAMLDLLPR